MREFWQAAWKQTDSTAEHIDFRRVLADDPLSADQFGELPIRVLTAASFLGAPFIADENTRHALQSEWDALQRDFHALSSDKQAVYLEQSGHFM
ncbi:MAG: hypothetical protein CPDRYMAC_4862 [uncultured Paraburkholderia sp.]|nr:MAG: hypothetical protein CPDRYDRY_4793 [uncultured Paraburkholderia sp.]CAH2938604.1 MAG: hypothetical protein CPDRYMAC_4862 [uncultured Paraburkholderia sp.]